MGGSQDMADLSAYSFYCRRGEALLCEDFSAHGVLNLDGGFAEYVSFFVVNEHEL